MEGLEIRTIDREALRSDAADQPFRPIGYALASQGLDTLPAEGLPRPLAELYRWMRLEELASSVGRGPLQGPRNIRQLAYGMLFSPLLAAGGALYMGGIWWLALLFLVVFAALPGALLTWVLETEWLAARLGILESQSFFFRSGRLLVENLPDLDALASELGRLEDGIEEGALLEAEILALRTGLAERIGAGDPAVAALGDELRKQRDLQSRARELASGLHMRLAELGAYREEIRRRAETEWMRERAGQVAGGGLLEGAAIEVREAVLFSEAERLRDELETASLQWRARNSL
jgi:hypothetical protein